MSTLAEMRTEVRNFVRDNNADSSKWKVTDAEMDTYLTNALDDYSLHFPLQKVDTTSPPITTIALPSDAIPGEQSVEFVEVSSELWTWHKVEEGASLPTTGKFWYWRAGVIALSTTPVVDVTLWYKAVYPFPTGDAVAFTIPSTDNELLVLYAAAKWHEKIGTVAAKLDRFKEKGDRDDNPLIMMHQVIMLDYHTKVNDRLRKGAVRLRRVGSNV